MLLLALLREEFRQVVLHKSFPNIYGTRIPKRRKSGKGKINADNICNIVKALVTFPCVALLLEIFYYGILQSLILSSIINRVLITAHLASHLQVTQEKKVPILHQPPQFQSWLGSFSSRQDSPIRVTACIPQSLLQNHS